MNRINDTYGNLKIVAEQREYRTVDYYLEIPNAGREYAFTRNYTVNTYALCRGGIRVDDLLHAKTRDKSVMHLVKYANRIVPYLVEEILGKVA